MNWIKILIMVIKKNINENSKIKSHGYICEFIK